MIMYCQKRYKLFYNVNGLTNKLCFSFMIGPMQAAVLAFFFKWGLRDSDSTHSFDATIFNIQALRLTAGRKIDLEVTNVIYAPIISARQAIGLLQRQRGRECVVWIIRYPPNYNFKSQKGNIDLHCQPAMNYYIFQLFYDFNNSQ